MLKAERIYPNNNGDGTGLKSRAYIVHMPNYLNVKSKNMISKIKDTHQPYAYIHVLGLVINIDISFLPIPPPPLFYKYDFYNLISSLP